MERVFFYRLKMFKLWLLGLGINFLLLCLPATLFAQISQEDSLIKTLETLREKGYYQQAIKTGETLLRYRQKYYPNSQVKIAQTYSLLGVLSESLGQSFKSIQYLKKALQIQESLFGNQAPQNSFLHINLADIYRTINKPSEAIIHSRKALKAIPEGNYSLFTGLGLGYYQMAQYDSALYFYQKALKFENKPGVLTNIGDTYLKIGKPDQAIDYYESAHQKSNPFYVKLSLYYRLAQGWQAKASQAIVASLQQSWRHKALTFLQQADSLLKTRQRSLQAEKDKLVLGHWVQAITELGLNISYDLYDQTSPTDQTLRQKWRSIVFYFGERQKANVLLENLKKETTLFNIQPKQIQQQLNRAEAVITYSFGKDALYAFIITKEQVVLRALPQDSLKKYWKAYNLYMHVPLFKECIHYMHQFYKWLVAPIYPWIGSKKRWLVIGGVLNVLPFDTFCKYKGADVKKTELLDINYQQFPYLIKTHTICYAPSATLAFLPKPSHNYQLDFLGVAPGIYQDTIHFRPLKYAAKEVNNIAQSIKQRTKVLLGKMATREQILKEGQKARWLHFATHGVPNLEVDLNGILLYDGKWLIKDIQNIKLQNDLVVMSSCNAIAGKFVKGEGLVAMTRSFLKAGARNIVYTLWSVNDRLAARMMTSFYKHLTQGLDYAEALRQAKLEFLRDPKPVYGYPGLWAVFMLEGRYFK